MTVAAPWYTSAVLWTDAGTAFGALSIVIAVILWRLGGPRRLVIYNIPSVTALLAAGDPGDVMRSELKVTYGKHTLNNPYIVTLHVESKSHRDIRSSDFDSDEPLIFELGSPIKTPLATSGKLTAASNGIIVDDTSVRINPALIRKGDSADIKLLLDGPPALTCRSPIVDVTVREQATSHVQSLKYYAWFLVIMTLVFFWVGISLLAQETGELARVGLTPHARYIIALSEQRGFMGGILTGFGITFILLAFWAIISWRKSSIRRYQHSGNPNHSAES
jgi:hypothetical protein